MWLLPLVLVGFAGAERLAIPVEYSLDDWQSAHKLGDIHIREDFSGNYSATFDAFTDSAKLGKDLQQHSGSVYRVRTPLANGGYLTSSTDPCRILTSRLVHYFWVAIDGSSHKVNSLTVYPDTSFVSNEPCKFSNDDQLHGVVKVASTHALKGPDTHSFLEKMEKERRARQHGAEQDNRSILAKYWMYIVPVVIFMLISSAVNNDQGGGQAA